MGRSSPSCATLPRRPSQNVAGRRLEGMSTPELAAELYRRLCVGYGVEPGPFRGTMLKLYLKCLLEEPANSERRRLEQVPIDDRRSPWRGWTPTTGDFLRKASKGFRKFPQDFPNRCENGPFLSNSFQKFH